MNVHVLLQVSDPLSRRSGWAGPCVLVLRGGSLQLVTRVQSREDGIHVCVLSD